MRNLSFDFNPRTLVVTCTEPHASLAEAWPSLDAIFIPTRGRPQFVLSLLRDLRREVPSTPVFLLPSSSDEYKSNGSELFESIQSLSSNDDIEFVEAVQSLHTMQNGLFGTRDIDWDLPTKRNYALWYARRNRFSRILLLDDDIRDISASIIKHGNSLLQSFMVCGLFVDEFPDTSVTGHAEIVLGEDVRTFLSGNSLFLRANTDLGFFPKIYNEDWIFMIPHVHAKQVAAAGVIQQEPYDPFVSAALAEFQEPGEVIADGLLALVNACAYDRRFDQDTWRELLGIRRQWLADLKSRVPYERQRVAMGTALCRCQSILEDDCVRFVEDWEKDCETWRSLIRG